MADEMKQTGEMIPERDMLPVAKELDALMLDDALDNVEGALGPKEGVAADVKDEEAETEDAAMDTKPMEEALGVSADRAKAIFEAAQMMPRFDGMSPTDIADMLASDMQLRMQVEQMAARMEDMATQEGAMGEEKPMEPASEEGMEPQGAYSLKEGVGGPSLGRPDMDGPTRAVAKPAMGGPSLINMLTPGGSALAAGIDKLRGVAKKKISGDGETKKTGRMVDRPES